MGPILPGGLFNGAAVTREYTVVLSKPVIIIIPLNICINLSMFNKPLVELSTMLPPPLPASQNSLVSAGHGSIEAVDLLDSVLFLK